MNCLWNFDWHLRFKALRWPVSLSTINNAVFLTCLGIGSFGHLPWATSEAVPSFPIIFSESLKPGYLAIILYYFCSTGYCITKPEVVFKIEQGEEPWILEAGFPSHCNQGELVTAQAGGRQGNEVLLGHWFRVYCLWNILQKFLFLILDLWKWLGTVGPHPSITLITLLHMSLSCINAFLCPLIF